MIILYVHKIRVAVVLKTSATCFRAKSFLNVSAPSPLKFICRPCISVCNLVKHKKVLENIKKRKILKSCSNKTQLFFLDLVPFYLVAFTLQAGARGKKYTPSIICYNFFTVVKQGISVSPGNEQKMTSTCNMQLSFWKKSSN